MEMRTTKEQGSSSQPVEDKFPCGEREETSCMWAGYQSRRSLCLLLHLCPKCCYLVRKRGP